MAKFIAGLTLFAAVYACQFAALYFGFGLVPTSVIGYVGFSFLGLVAATALANL